MLAIIAAIALGLGIDPRLAQELALRENAKLDPYAVGITGDLGIMQLNPRYLDYFVRKHWERNAEEVRHVLGEYAFFNWRNPEHNIFVGLSVFRQLKRHPQLTVWAAIVAYNCGLNRVLDGRVPIQSVNMATHIYTRWRNSEGVILK